MKFTKSIRWRLLLWIALFLSLALAALDFTAYEMYFTNRIDQLDVELHRRTSAISRTIFAPGPAIEDAIAAPEQEFFSPAMTAKPPEPEKIAASMTRFQSSDPNGFYFAIWLLKDTGPFLLSSNAPDDLSRPRLATKDTGTHTRTRGDFRETFHATERGDCVLTGHRLTPENAAAARFTFWLVLGSLAMLGCGLGGASFIIARALRPVEKIGAAARHIASGHLSERITAHETDSELGQLAEVLNNTFARLETAFAQQKRFTADAAHELRTPLTVLITESQLTLARERSTAEYKESVAASLETAQQMRKLANSLLELSRFDAGQEKLEREPTDLAVLAQECVKLITPLAEERSIRIHTDLPSTTIKVDAERIRQTITNLLTNAVRYNRDKGGIFITVQKEEHLVVLAVADTGNGISATDLPRVFERFYRADKSRASGGSGLGLAISKAIAEAHGGTIEVSSEIGRGSIFTLRLPV
jgi:heavy metal sensor kinase